MTKQSSLSRAAWLKRGFVLILAGIGFVSMGAGMNPGISTAPMLKLPELFDPHLDKTFSSEMARARKSSGIEQKMQLLYRSTRLIDRSA